MPTHLPDRRGWLGHSRTQWTRNAQIVTTVLAGTPLTIVGATQGLTRERLRHMLNTTARQANRPLYEQLQVAHGKRLVPLGVLLAHAEDFLPFVKPNVSHFLPHLRYRLTTNSAGIIGCTMTQHGHQDTQESVANIA